MKAWWPQGHERTKIAAFAPARQNRWIWNSRACARATRVGCIQHLNKSRHWILPCGAVERSTTSPWKSARPPGRGGVSLNYYLQATELPDLKAACPEYAEVNAQVLQDAPRRLDRAFQAFFRRIRNGETPGYLCFQGKDRYNSFTYPQYGGGAVLDGGVLSLSKIGRICIRLHRSLEGRPRRSRSAEKPMAGMHASRALMCPCSRFPQRVKRRA